MKDSHRDPRQKPSTVHSSGQLYTSAQCIMVDSVFKFASVWIWMYNMSQGLITEALARGLHAVSRSNIQLNYPYLTGHPQAQIPPTCHRKAVKGWQPTILWWHGVVYQPGNRNAHHSYCSPSIVVARIPRPTICCRGDRAGGPGTMERLVMTSWGVIPFRTSHVQTFRLTSILM